MRAPTLTLLEIASCPRCGALADERDIVNGEVVWVRYSCGNYTGSTFFGEFYCDAAKLREALLDLAYAIAFHVSYLLQRFRR